MAQPGAGRHGEGDQQAAHAHAEQHQLLSVLRCRQLLLCVCIEAGLDEQGPSAQQRERGKCGEESGAVTSAARTLSLLQSDSSPSSPNPWRDHRAPRGPAPRAH